jgi:hypothetical protein
LYENKNLITRYEEKLKHCDNEYRAKEEELELTRATLESQVKTLMFERDNINDLLDKKTDELSRARKQFESEQRSLISEIQSLKTTVTNLTDDLER